MPSLFCGQHQKGVFNIISLSYQKFFVPLQPERHRKRMNIVIDEGKWYGKLISEGNSKGCYRLTEFDDAKSLIIPRSMYAHKGTCGHALLIAGNYGIAGCAVLAARACLRGGVGKLTVMTNPANIPMLQISVPEAIVCSNEIHIGYDPTYTCTCTAIGPGIGTDINTFGLLKSKIESTKSAMVIDADAITLIGRDKSLLSILPHESILTPHHAELKRLIGKTANKYDELEKTRLLCMKYHLNIVIKGAYSAVVNSDGTVYFNTTGNPGMATAGSGDVLTGLILALLAQGYEPKNALRLSVFLHGLAGDIAAEEHTIFGITAGDIADNIGRAYKRLLTV